MSVELRENDVVRYDPPSTWCYEGMAIARRRPDGSIILADTYWITDQKIVTPDTWELLFNLDDYKPVGEWTWERYDPADRAFITSQGSRHFFVRKGASESRRQIIANAREALAEAEEKLESAERTRDSARRFLDSLLAAEPTEEKKRG